jgi:hypothetical protein
MAAFPKAALRWVLQQRLGRCGNANATAIRLARVNDGYDASPFLAGSVTEPVLLS